MELFVARPPLAHVLKDACIGGGGFPCHFHPKKARKRRSGSGPTSSSRKTVANQRAAKGGWKTQGGVKHTVNSAKNQQEKNWEHSGPEGIRKFLPFSEFRSFSPRKIAKFSLNFWPVRVHEKPSFRYVPSTFFAKKARPQKRFWTPHLRYVFPPPFLATLCHFP